VAQVYLFNTIQLGKINKIMKNAVNLPVALNVSRFSLPWMVRSKKVTENKFRFNILEIRRQKNVVFWYRRQTKGLH
jgi:hypothetical protein